MKCCVRVYIEGGSTGQTADSDFRRGWKKFLGELHDLARGQGFHSLEVVRCKGRVNAFARFSKYHWDHPDDLCVLLVDSECNVPDGQGVWETVSEREGDGWVKPAWASESHLFLMVPFVETWLVADPDALASYFGQGFRPLELPGLTNLEERSKDDLERRLKRATAAALRGPYRHGLAHLIIEKVNPDRVRTLRHGRRLFEELGRLIQQTG